MPSAAFAPYQAATLAVMLIVLLAMQSAPPVERVMLPDPAADHFDLATARPSSARAACDLSGAGTDVVVCGRKTIKVEARQFPDFTEEPLLAGIDLPGGGRAAVTMQHADVGGTPSRRVMVGIKLPF